MRHGYAAAQGDALCRFVLGIDDTGHAFRNILDLAKSLHGIIATFISIKS